MIVIGCVFELETSEWNTPTLGAMWQDLLVTTIAHECAGNTTLQIAEKVGSEM